VEAKGTSWNHPDTLDLQIYDDLLSVKQIINDLVERHCCNFPVKRDKIYHTRLEIFMVMKIQVIFWALSKEK
jgi:hypothetical protein